MLYYEFRDSLSLDEILSRLDDMLDDFVYRKIWEGLSAKEKEIMRLLSDTPVKVKNLCDRLSMTSASFSRYRERLLKRGLIEANGHGYVSLSLPRFASVIQFYEDDLSF